MKTARVPVTFVNHARNFGEHNAVMTGLRHARGAFVITMDDDLQNPPEEVLKLYDHARLGGWDVVYTRYAEKKHDGWRNLGSRFANWVADKLLDKPKGLYLSSFRCMSALVVREVTKYSGPYPYVDGLIMQVTQRIDSIEVLHLARAEGRSNYTVARLVRLWLNLATNFSVLPLRLAIFAGAAMGVLGLLGAALVMAEAAGGSTPSGWASVMTVILLLSGVQFLILGVLGEYLYRVLEEVLGRPAYVVRSEAGAARTEALEGRAQRCVEPVAHAGQAAPAREARLVLAQAPAGFGKTTLTSLWANLKMAFGTRYTRSNRLGDLYEQHFYRRVADRHQGRPREMRDLLVDPAGEQRPFKPRAHNWRRRAKVPVLVLNATSLNSGHAWQFTGRWMGEPPESFDTGIDMNERYRRLWYEQAPEDALRGRLRQFVEAMARGFSWP